MEAEDWTIVWTWCAFEVGAIAVALSLPLPLPLPKRKKMRLPNGWINDFNAVLRVAKSIYRNYGTWWWILRLHLSTLRFGTLNWLDIIPPLHWTSFYAFAFYISQIFALLYHWYNHIKTSLQYGLFYSSMSTLYFKVRSLTLPFNPSQDEEFFSFLLS